MEGFYHLLNQKIYHRDIKPGNIVFSKQKMSFMIIDYGEAEWKPVELKK